MLGNKFEIPFAKVLSAWQSEFKGSLLTLHESAPVARRVGILLPSLFEGKANQQLPEGWLVLPRTCGEHDSENQATMQDYVQTE